MVQDILAKELKHSAVIHIGRPLADDRTFERVVHLIKDPTVRPLARREAQPKPASRRRKMRA